MYLIRILPKHHLTNIKMKNVLPLLLSILLFVNFSCGNNASTTTTPNKDSAKDKMEDTKSKGPEVSPAKKYDIKSGIITYESNMEMTGIKIHTKKVLYFDDYGVKEAEEEYKTMGGSEKLSERNFVNDGYHYIVSIENKGGIKSKMSGTGVAARFNMDEASTMKDNQYKKVADETICGKTCSGFSMVTPSGTITMYGWNGIALKTTVENTAAKMKTVTIATKIEENASIPADKFEVPTDIKITEQ